MFPEYTSLGTLTLGGNPAALTQGSNSGLPSPQCGPLPGTILRVFIPAGAVVNLLNLIELNSPSGICLIVRLPFLGGGSSGTNVQSIINAVQSAGGRVEVSQ